MDRKAETEWDVLRRIIALLFALAELADRAGLAPSPVRCHVLAILRQAEAVAQAFVVQMARDLGATMPPPAYLTIAEQMCAQAGDEPVDATRLALRLRVLGLTLVSLSAGTDYSGSECAWRLDRRIVHHAKIDVQVERRQKLVRPTDRSGWQRAPPRDVF